MAGEGHSGDEGGNMPGWGKQKRGANSDGISPLSSEAERFYLHVIKRFNPNLPTGEHSDFPAPLVSLLQDYTLNSLLHRNIHQGRETRYNWKNITLQLAGPGSIHGSNSHQE